MSGASDRVAADDDTPPLQPIQVWRDFVRYFDGSAIDLVVVAVTGAAQSISALPVLVIVRYTLNSAIPKGAVSTLIEAGLGIVACRFIFSALSLFGRAFALRIGKHAIGNLREDLLANMYEHPINFFRRNDAARLQTRIVMETERLDNLVGNLLSNIIPAVLGSIVLGAVLIYLNLRLTFILGLMLPVAWIGASVTGRGIKREVKIFQSAFERFSEGVQFVLRQMDLTRNRGFERGEMHTQTGHIRDLERSGVKMAMIFAVHSQVQSNLIGFGGLLLLVAGGIAVARHAMSLGDLLAFYLAAGILNGYISTLTNAIPDIIAGNQSLKKLARLQPRCNPPDYDGTKPVPPDIELDISGVRFSYDDAPLLDSIELRVAPRDIIAIYGPNGSGKSTLINLILGYHRPEAGTIRVGSVPYDQIDLRDLRRRIGLVPQRPTFFTGSIAENIAYGWAGVSREDIEHAALTAGAMTFIAGLSNGLDSMIGEGGTLVSGGEAQKLAIARALVGRPGLLILDEPTNHLDLKSVGAIMQRLSRLSPATALIMISHDPAISRFCDRIFNLQNGRLVEINVRSTSIASAAERSQ